LVSIVASLLLFSLVECVPHSASFVAEILSSDEHFRSR
jgi:hypothetical protein